MISAYRLLASFVIVNMRNPFNFWPNMPPSRLTMPVRRNVRPGHVNAMMEAMFVDFKKNLEEVGRAVYARNRDH